MQIMNKTGSKQKVFSFKSTVEVSFRVALYRIETAFVSLGRFNES